MATGAGDSGLIPKFDVIFGPMTAAQHPVRVPLAACPWPTLVCERSSGRVLHANEAAARLFGKSAVDELLGACPFSSLSCGGSEQTLQIRGETYRLGTQPVDIDGQDQILAQLHPCATDDSELARLGSSFRALADQVPGAIFRYRLRPDGTDAVTYMSSGCVELWEVPSDRIRNDATLLWEMVDPEDVPGLRASVLESARTLEPWSWEWRITTPSGRRKWLSAKGRPSRVEDGTVEWNSLILDVTELVTKERQRVELEEQLKRASRMESIGRLAGGIAHDFNNILTIIRGNAESAHAVVDGDTQVLLEEILDASERSAVLTRQLLTFSRAKPSEPRPVELASHVSSMIAFLDRLVGDDISIRLETETCPCWVAVDPSEIDQILTNLAANARDALEEGGDLTVRVRPGTMGHLPCRLEVEDTGPGIPEDILEHVFEPFFSTKDSGINAGLGLATVDAIVRRRGGAIEVRSQVGIGTTFIIELPRVERAPEEPAPAPPEAPRGAAKGRVLLVEDDDQVRRVVERLLRSFDCQVVQASSAGEALNLLESLGASVQVLLTDSAMRGMGGPELVRVTKDRFPHVVPILMSGHLTPMARRPGEVPVLSKPFRACDLREVIQAALSGQL